MQSSVYDMFVCVCVFFEKGRKEILYSLVVYALKITLEE